MKFSMKKVTVLLADGFEEIDRAGRRARASRNGRTRASCAARTLRGSPSSRTRRCWG